MKKLIVLFAASFVIFACLLPTLSPAIVPSTNFPDTSTTFLGPTFSTAITHPLGDNTAYSISGEAGARDFRIGSTLGGSFSDYQRLKLSGEYLWQKTRYDFISGEADPWLGQGAFGASYQYDFSHNCFSPQFILNAYYSHARSKNLLNKNITLLSQNVPLNFIELRHIAGSDASGISPGLIVQPWYGARLEFDYNYDHVDYDTKYRLDDPEAKGSGGTVSFNQFLSDAINAGAVAEFRQPFNFYQLNLTWTNPCNRNLTVAITTDYVHGKTDLPNTYSVGLNVNYLIDAPHSSALRNSNRNGACCPCRDPILAWVSQPAVRMPQVLAIAEERLISAQQPTPSCTPPFTIGQLPPQEVVQGLVNQYATAPFFSGQNLTFSLIIPPGSPIIMPPNSTTIDPNTGQITLIFLGFQGFDTPITVVATNECGSAQMTFIVEFDP